ncbi:MAG: hypothetical protein U0176_12890 [Bacteroidia bacterium]
MRRLSRPEQPEFLKENWEKWGEQFKSLRAKNAGAKFQWPTFEKQRINIPLSELLATASQEHCAYCDFHPLGSKEDSIDHFRPKSHPAFHHLVCKWENLYFSCPNCQGFKKEQWSNDPILIAPDEEGYSFQRFFIIDSRTWQIEVNPTASASDQLRAEYTIETLGLRDSKHAIGRRVNQERYDLKIQANEEINLDDFAYRYLFE